MQNCRLNSLNRILYPRSGGFQPLLHAIAHFFRPRAPVVHRPLKEIAPGHLPKDAAVAKSDFYKAHTGRLADLLEILIEGGYPQLLAFSEFEVRRIIRCDPMLSGKWQQSLP